MVGVDCVSADAPGSFDAGDGGAAASDTVNNSNNNSNNSGHCTNGVQDVDETDVDCGGPTCGACPANRGCRNGPDCVSKICMQGQCKQATCTDGVQNGNETAVDCGGPTCDSCTSNGSFHWETGSWGSCSKPCGGGQKTRNVQCVDGTGQPVAESKCTNPKPARSQQCNTQMCASYAWKTGSWGSCSAPCGGGTQTRMVQCVDTNTGTAVSGSNCSGAKPTNSRSCNTQQCKQYAWDTGTWSACNVQCGKGKQTRTVNCIETNSGATASESNCSGSKPQSSRSCDAGPCRYEWKTGSWSTCNSQCKHSRNVWCQNVTKNVRASGSDCSGTKPRTQESCTGGSCVQTETNCNDSIDNDNDGTTDCNDSDCSSASNCMMSTEGSLDCDNGKDDDSDGKTDCADSDCDGDDCDMNGYKEAICKNSVCFEDACANGEDDNRDGFADCTDSDCSGTSACTKTGESGLDCDDGVDNDGDGSTDCADPSCSGLDCAIGGAYGTAVCYNGSCKETDCSNGIDDDGDGSTDTGC